MDFTGKMIIVLFLATAGMIALQLWIMKILKEVLWQNRFLMSIFQKPFSMNSSTQICKNCKYRLSYIHLDGEQMGEFYYVCRKHKKEIDLYLSCPSFKDDHMNEPNIKK